jgi:hypothetical protein
MTEAGEDEEMDETTSLFPSILVEAVDQPVVFTPFSTHGPRIGSSFVPQPLLARSKDRATMAPPAATTDVTEVFYTLDEIQKHASAEDCWLIIGNAKTGTYRLFAFL